MTKIPNNKNKIRSFNGTHNDDYDDDALRGLPVNTCLQTINDTNVKNQNIYIMAPGKGQMTMILDTSSKVHGFPKKFQQERLVQSIPNALQNSIQKDI